MLKNKEYKIYPLGDSALTIELGNEISEETNNFAVALSHKIAETGFFGFIESVPAYGSVTVFYDPRKTNSVARAPETSFLAVRRLVSGIFAGLSPGNKADRKVIVIPVDFSEHCAPDLEFIARHSGLDAESVVDVFISREYRVYMLGFVPGFAYMGKVDRRISAPRMESPRKVVARGSVGIAGQQTGVYPIESPGGWRLIGRTGVELFNAEGSSPVLFAPGDRVRFVRA